MSFQLIDDNNFVVPAEAWTQRLRFERHWIPAFAGMTVLIDDNNFVVPAEAGTQRLCFERHWIPDFAGMTESFWPPSLIYSMLNNPFGQLRQHALWRSIANLC